MKIINLKKINQNQYEITFENEAKIKLYDDVVLEHKLLVDKELSSSQLDDIEKANNIISAYYNALKYLNTKMRSSLEVKKYLKKRGSSKEGIQSAMSRLIKEGYLDDKKFMVSYVNDQFNLTNNGPIKIKRELNKLGINNDDITINKDFSDKLKKLVDKKVKANNKHSKEILKRNIRIYLYDLGYSEEMYKPYVDNIMFDESAFLAKEYKKLYRKYKDKYTEYELKMFIKQKLYSKGYDYELINNIVGED